MTNSAGRSGRRRGRTLAATLALGVAVAAVAVPVAARAATAVPAQYLAKLYTEVLGRAPDQAGWQARIAYYASAGCSRRTLSDQGEVVFGSAEYQALRYTPAQQLLTAYRMVLNREPDQPGFDHYLALLTTGGQSVRDVVATLYGSAEFGALLPAICSSTSDYDFGGTPAIALPAVGVGFRGDDASLQAALDATPAGGTVTLAESTVVPLSRPLVLPPGVTLQTTGAPGPAQYAKQARLVRTGVFAGAAVEVSAGAHLSHVWVDGARTRAGAYDRSRYNVAMLGGTGTTVTGNRIGNTAGATNVESLGSGDGHPCAGNEVSGNLIDAYSSQHAGGLWSDGISMHCEDVDVHGNAVLDATDVGIIVFALDPAVPQHSQVYGNVVVQAGQSAFGMLGADPFFTAGGGDPAGVTSRSLAGASIRDNLLWTGPAVHSTFGLTVGTKAWFGTEARNASGGSFTGNTTGALTVRVQTGIVVSGVLGTTVRGNTLHTTLVGVGSGCPRAEVGASVTAGFAGGDLPVPYTDALYSGCLDAGD